MKRNAKTSDIFQNVKKELRCWRRQPTSGSACSPLDCTCMCVY